MVDGSTRPRLLLEVILTDRFRLSHTSLVKTILRFSSKLVKKKTLISFMDLSESFPVGYQYPVPLETSRQSESDLVEILMSS